MGNDKESDPQMQLACCDALNVQCWQNICSHNAFTVLRSMVPEIRHYVDQSSKQRDHNKQVAAQHPETLS
jgi:hypothetical protein